MKSKNRSADSAPQWALLALGLVLLLLILGCFGPRSRSELSFDEIERLVEDKTAQQIALLFGQPDSRQVVFDDDERWIWWNYTYLDGADYPPEVRGRVVHLEILFKNPARYSEKRSPYNEWYIDRLLGVRYKSISAKL